MMMVRTNTIWKDKEIKMIRIDDKIVMMMINLMWISNNDGTVTK